MKMKMAAAAGENNAVLNAGKQLSMAGSSSAAASAYDAAGDSAYATGITKAGTSLLSGMSDIFKEGRKSGWFKGTPATPNTTVPSGWSSD
jgi:hypothetical protein